MNNQPGEDHLHYFTLFNKWTGPSGDPPPPTHPQLYDQSFPFSICMCSLLLSSSPQTSLEPPSMRLLSTTFHFPFDHFPLPVPHISSLLPLFLPPLLPLLPGALCRRCHNRRWNRFICSNVVRAAAWHGAEQHFPPAHRASLPLCLQFMCFQTGQSTPLSCAGLSLPLPPTISALSVSVKSHQSSLTQTIISSGKLQWPDSPFFTFTAFLCSHLSRFFEHTNPLPNLSVVFCCLHYFANPLLPSSSSSSSSLLFSLQAKPAIGHIALINLSPLHRLITTSLHKNKNRLFPGVEKTNSKCCCLFIFYFNVTTTGAPGSYVTPNTAMQTAVM